MAGDPDESGRASRRGSEPAPDRRFGSDGTVGPESGSPASSPGDADARGIRGSALPRTGPGLAVPDVGPPEGSRADGGSPRVEPSWHVVNRGENFWTISRLYYGSGDYYRALWKANSKKYPNIAEIHINDVILIPAVEDLDPDYVGPPRRRQPASRGGTTDGDVAGPAEALAATGTDQPKLRSFPTTRTTPRSDASEGLPARRNSRVEAELELPVAGPEEGPVRGGRGSSDHRPGEEDDAPASRRIARTPRADSVERPVYRVRRYDTLRSIARDILGDSRRSEEIYDINRDIIDDPTRLTPGQLLELPEDADTRRVTARDRYRDRD